MEKHQITFIAGYWEWHVCIDNEVVYAFPDLSEELSDINTKEQLVSSAEDLIEMMFTEFEMKKWNNEIIDEKALGILKENREQLVCAISDRLAYEYAIV